MPTIDLKIQSDLSAINSAFSQGDALIDKTSDSVKKFATTSNAAFKTVTTETNKFNTEVKSGAKEMDYLNKSVHSVATGATRIKEIKNEIKALTGEAIAAGKGTDAFREKLEKVGELKHELAEISNAIKSVSGNLAGNFARAAGDATSLIATGFEGATAAANLFGNSTENIEEQIKKLQAIQSLANITREFSEIKEKVHDIKLAFGPVTDTFKTFYTAGNEGLKNLGKNGFGSISGLASGFKSFFSSVGSGFKSFFSSAISGAKSLFAVLAANPFAIVLIVIVAIIGAMVALKDKIKPIGKLFDAIGDAISYIGDKLEQLGQFFGIAATEAEKANQKIIDSGAEVLKQIEKRYDTEIGYLKAAGASTSKAEKEKTDAVLSNLATQLSALKWKQSEGEKLNKEELASIKELNEKTIDVITEATTRELTERREAREKIAKDAEENAKKVDAANKAANDKLKALRKEYSDFLKGLLKQEQDAEISLLTGEDKVNAQRQADQKSIDELKKTLLQKKIAAHEGNELTKEENDIFRELELVSNHKQAEDLLKIAVDNSNALADQHKKDIDNEVEFNDLKTKIAIEAVNGSKNTTGLSQAEFEKAKQRQILKIQLDAIKETQGLKSKQIQSDAASQLQADENALKQLQGLTDEKSKIKADGLEKDIEAIREKAALELQLLNATTAAEIEDLQKKIADIDKKIKGNPFQKIKDYLQKALKLTPEQLSTAIQGFEQLGKEISSAISQQLDSQQSVVDKELEANQVKIDARQQNLDDLKSKLSAETDLQKQGLANNVDAVKAQIAANQAAMQQDLINKKKIQEENKKLAKEKFILDTATQASNLLVASTEIFSTYAEIPFVGIPLAIALIGTMIGAFVASKSSALKAINAGQTTGFKKGGYTGNAGIDEEAGVVHGKEFVITADKTKKHRDLFEGIHTNDKLLMHEGIMNLLKDSGIQLQPNLPAILSGKRDSIAGFSNQKFNHNKGLEERIDFLNEQVKSLIKDNKNKTIALPNGNIIEKFGNITRTTRKK